MSFLLRTFGPVSGPSPKRNRRKNPFWRFRRFVFAVALAGLMVAGAGLYAFNQTVVPDDPFEELVQTSLICTAEVTEVGGCTDERSAAQLSLEEIREIVEYEDIPLTVINTTLGAEDVSFFEHSGVDPRGLARAAYVNLQGSSVQGGSTITQQLVKISLLSNERSYERKLKEAALAIQLEKDLTDQEGGKQEAKEEILYRYLNQIFYGRQAYGVQAASRIYFNKDIDELTISEAALLAVQVRAPSSNPLSDPDLTRTRVSAVIDRMEEAELATPEEIATARATDVVASLQEYVPAENLGDVIGADVGSKYFLESVRIELEKIYPNNESYTGGFRVYTTLDQEKQRLAYETVLANPQTHNPEFRSSIVTIDDQGRVVSMVGGTDFEANRFNLATNGLENGDGRQPGSTFKPFALAELIERGDSGRSLFDTSGPDLLVLARADNGADWNVRGKRSGGADYIDAVEGLERSSNHVYARMALEVTPAKIAEMATSMGIRQELTPINSLVLGTVNVAPIDMASAYSTFEREGEALRPALIERIENANGEVLCWYPDPDDPATDCSDREGRQYESNERPVRTGEQVIRPETAGNVTYAMEGVVSRGPGTGKAARVDGRRVAGKTGTTQNNYDAWFVGFSCDATTAVWVGNDDNTDLLDENGRDIGGGNLPAEMWSQYMTQYLADAPDCTNEEWPSNSNFQGTVLNTDLKNRNPVIPCVPSGVPAQEDPTMGGSGGDRLINCIAYNANNPNDPNNPANPNSPFFNQFGGQGDNNDDDDDDDDEENPASPTIVEPPPPETTVTTLPQPLPQPVPEPIRANPPVRPVQPPVRQP